MKKPYVVGITGGSASGKTSFLKKLMSGLEKPVCVISQDDYYKPREVQPLDKNGVENYDTPDSIDLEAFLSDMKRVFAGEEVIRTEYTFNNPAIQPGKIILRPAEVMIVEGIFLLSHPGIAELIDLKLFMEAPEQVKLERRIRRDLQERGYDAEDVRYRYRNHVFPNYEKHIAPYKAQADLIIPNFNDFDKPLELVLFYLNMKLKS